MKVKIGAIGPSDSLKQIREVAKKDSRIELIEFEYTHPDQLHRILDEHRYDVTQWIFSGQNPYYYSLHHGLITEEEASFPPLHGISLLGTCMRVVHDRGEVVKRMSLDTVDRETVGLVMNEFSLQDLSIELYPYHHYKPYDELIDFHVKEFEKGNTEVALTCLLNVYNALVELGIPCYRLVPSQLAIQTVFNILISRANSQIYEKLKVAILGFELIGNEAGNGSLQKYEDRKRSLRLGLHLVHVAELLNGTLIDRQDGRFQIYTTYGDIELLQTTQSLVDVVKEVELQMSNKLMVGIGSGYTVYEAERHVDFAFSQEPAGNETSIMFVDEDKKVIDYSKENTSYYTVENIPEYWKQTLQENSYTSLIPAKIYHFLKLKRISQFSSELITSLLKNTDRNTRRILSDLEQMGLLEVVGEESSGRPGRPKKTYAIVSDSSINA
jgi:hypothetical protein